MNEVYSPCNGHCRPTCATGTMIACTMQCQSGCNCKEGYILNEVGGECIAIDQCPNTKSSLSQLNGGPVSFAQARGISDTLQDHETEIKGGQRNIPFNLSKQAQLVIGVLAFLCALCACFKCWSVFIKLQTKNRKNSRAGSNSSNSSYESATRTAVEADVEWSDNSDSKDNKDVDNEDIMDNDKDQQSLLSVAVSDRKDDGKDAYADMSDNALL